MISFAPFLHRNPPEGHGHGISPNHALSILLDGIALHAPPSGDDDLAAFLESIADLSREVNASTTPERDAIIARSAVRAMEDHTQAARELLAGRDRELEEMRDLVELLTGFLTRSGLANRDATSTIGEILASTVAKNRGFSRSRSGTLAALSGKLSECFDISLDAIRQFAAAPTQPDSTTGLPGPDAAVAAVTAMWEHRESVSAVVFSIERMAGINARFGCITADELLRNLSRHLTASLGPADQLYRWRGPHLMALIQRDIASASPSMEIARIAEWGSEHAVTVRDREVTVSASVAWDLFPLDVFAGVEDLLASINGFAVGNQLPPGQASRNSAIAELAVLDSK